jgi:hypothetical protein
LWRENFPCLTKFAEEMQQAHGQFLLAVGDIYEDCAYHPVLGIIVAFEDDIVEGISLIDGTVMV